MLFLGITNLNAQRTPYQYSIPTSKFDFSINFWVNMHHFLYQESYLHLNHDSSLVTRDFLQKLNSKEVALFDSTVAFYEHEIHDKHFFFSDHMNAVSNLLTNSKRQLSHSENPDINLLIKQLRNFKKIYHKYLWPQHYVQNKRVLDKNVALIKVLEMPMSSSLSSLFHRNWQAAKIKVNISAYGALIRSSLRNVPYTNLNPTLITMTSSDYLLEQNGLWLELLFHEASHHLVFYNEGLITETIAKVSQEQKLKAPRGLWHAYLFYISGRVTQEKLKDHSYEVNQLYMERFQVFSTLYPSLKKLDQYIVGNKSLKEVTLEILKEIKL